MRSRILTTVLAAAISLCFASSASAFGFWGGWNDDDSDGGIELDKKWDYEWPDFDEWEWPKKDEDKKDYSWDWDRKWPKRDCWFCKPDDGPRSAIPEPTAALLFAGGAAVIASRRRRNR